MAVRHGNSQSPPSVYGPWSPGASTTFIAWCVNAAAVTSVSLSDATGATDTWNVSLSEWTSVSWPDFGTAGGSGTSTPTTALASTRTSTPYDLVVAAMGTKGGTISGTPGRDRPAARGDRPDRAVPAVPGGRTRAGQNFRYAGTGSGGTTGGSSITNIIPPADLVAGDLLIMDVVAWNATVSGWPGGYPQIAVTGGMDAANQRFVATKIADGSEVINMTVTLSGAGTASALLYSLRGAASATPLNTATAVNAGGQHRPGHPGTDCQRPV